MNHKHDPRFVMGQHPVAAVCKKCDMKQIANGGGWVPAAEAKELQRKVGVRGAL